MFRFFTDHYFQIGQAHYTAGKPCQDHAISWSSEDLACAIVSDGCSTGGNTDVGARILTFGTLRAIREVLKVSNGAPEFVSNRQLQLMKATQTFMGLEQGDMLATCIYVHCNQNGGRIKVQGDGVFTFKYRDGAIETQRFEWKDNVPFYPAYKGREMEAFIERHGSNLESSRLIKSTVYIPPSPGETSESSENYTLEQGINGINLDFSNRFLEAVEFIAVFTDGVTQIDGIPWHDAVREFLAFKNTTGEFVKRRMIRGIKDMQNNGKGPIDDISCAVIRVEEVEEEEVGS